MKILPFILSFIIFNQLSASASPDSSVTICKRNITVNSGKIQVKIRIEKPLSSGFARIYEKLPLGAEVSKVNAGKAVYKNEKSMLKFVWDEIPIDRDLEITYEIQFKNAVSDTLLAITGTFSAEFLPVETGQISIQPGSLEYIPKPLEIAKVEEKKEAKITEAKSIPLEVKSEEKQLSNAEGIYICIQVAAVGKNIPSDYLKKQFKYEGEFESHYEENIYRITVGKFKSLTEAEAVLKEYKEKYFKKCFLSAYRDGHKIPVYEAEKLLK